MHSLAFTCLFPTRPRNKEAFESAGKAESRRGLPARSWARTATPLTRATRTHAPGAGHAPHGRGSRWRVCPPPAAPRSWVRLCSRELRQLGVWQKNPRHSEFRNLPGPSSATLHVTLMLPHGVYSVLTAQSSGTAAAAGRRLACGAPRGSPGTRGLLGEPSPTTGHSY